jgi:putative inorganic carbon (hco3(-)) transporter
MSVTAAAWAVLAGFLVLLSLRRAVWAFALYTMTFFAAPQLWWWGGALPSVRFALWAGIILIVAVLLRTSRSQEGPGRHFTFVHIVAIGMAVNATVVHYLLASRPDVSIDPYVELLKFVLLFFLLWRAIETKKDFRIVLVALVLGAAYLGYEVTINDRGDFRGSRLEGVGAPGADTSNSLANVMLTMLPLIGGLFVEGTKRQKLIVLLAAPLALNVLLLCNSRGAFVGLIAAGAVFLWVARGPTRAKAIRVLALGAVALFLLLGDPKILDRFATTFAGSADRDRSAESRIEFWQAGLAMLADYPLGDGGNAFKYVHGPKYLAEITDADGSRSLHNGYLTEATDWGVQGLFLRLLFVGVAIVGAYRTSTRCRLEGRLDDSLVGICVIVSAAGFLIHCMFGAFMQNEWGYWVVALLVRYAALYRVADAPPVPVRVLASATQVPGMAGARP